MLVIIGAGCSLTSPAVDINTGNTGESLTDYKSAEFDYSLSYRNDWFLKQWTTGVSQPELVCITKTLITNEEANCTLSVVVNKSTLEKNVRDNLINREETTFAGKPATRITFKGDFGPTITSLLIPYGEYTIVISYDPADKNIASISEILNSFSFASTIGNDTKTPDTISKTFESEKGQFSYTLHWNPKLNTLLETALPEASEHAPSFNIVGGGTITVATGWIDSPGYTMASFINDTYYNGDDVFPSAEPKPISAGTTYPVYYFERTPKENNSNCWVKYAVIKDLNEALAVRMEDCTGSDRTVISAFGDVYSDLEIVSK